MNFASGVLTIDLASIQSNWLYINTITKDAECAAVVKADAYGVGASQVTNALFDVGCKTFFVATLEEASALAKLNLPNITIYVLGGVRPLSEPEFQRLNLIPVLFTLPDIERWMRYCHSIDLALPCAIKFDTGMTRLGVDVADIDRFFALVRGDKNFNPVLLLSHLACADDAEHELNRQQLTCFHGLLQKIKQAYPSVKMSLANSSGTFLGDEYHFDMVRLGAALYGINPQPVNVNPLKAVIALRLPVLQIRVVNKSATVGYSATHPVVKGTKLAVVAGGYADGVHRSLGLNPKGIVGGVLVHAIGRVSMDTCIFDVSSLSVEPEFIDVVGGDRTLDILIKETGSLGYEVLTSLGRRYQRQYLLNK